MSEKAKEVLKNVAEKAAKDVLKKTEEKKAPKKEKPEVPYIDRLMVQRDDLKKAMEELADVISNDRMPSDVKAIAHRQTFVMTNYHELLCIQIGMLTTKKK